MDLLLFNGPNRRVFTLAEPQRPIGTELNDPQGSWQKIRKQIWRTYDAFREKFDPQERICASLKNVHSLNIHHASRMNSDDARLRFFEYLRQQRYKHRRWLWIDSVLAFFGSFLMVVPGPNIFFFYPAARALSHYFAMKGVERVFNPNVLSLDSVPSLNFGPEPSIDRIEDSLDDLERVDSEIQKLERRYEIPNLKKLLAKV